VATHPVGEGASAAAWARVCLAGASIGKLGDHGRFEAQAATDTRPCSEQCTSLDVMTVAGLEQGHIVLNGGPPNPARYWGDGRGLGPAPSPRHAV